VTDTIDIPTIGIGAGPHCDGQVFLVDQIIELGEDTTLLDGLRRR